MNGNSTLSSPHLRLVQSNSVKRLIYPSSKWQSPLAWYVPAVALARYFPSRVHCSGQHIQELVLCYVLNGGQSCHYLPLVGTKASSDDRTPFQTCSF